MTIATDRFGLSAGHITGMRDIYEHLHANPELSMQEMRTAKYIRERLDRLGLETFICGGTGIVGILRNGLGPVVGYRADIDGLPIQEETGLDFASTTTGTMLDGSVVPVMHGCGHDTHITVGLTAALLMTENRGAWAGTAVFIFQPGEETAAGARAMVEDGLWDKAPKPTIIYGQHVWPGLAGTVNLSKGAAMAMADVESHGARETVTWIPARTVDRSDRAWCPHGGPNPDDRLAPSPSDEAGCGHHRDVPWRAEGKHHPDLR